ncbi:MAG: putative glyoxalase/bleomycin resistance protein/dioxygenase [Gemmatimonadetes bacterium]|nr:putative glyoxalase/bleomycin resistance protein/dioxygenase [Gemmatimonadota bacterium]
MVDLGYVMLFVSDLERSLRFYRDVLGLPVQNELRDMVEFRADGGLLTIHQAHQEGPHHHPPMVCGAMRLGFRVNDLDVVHAKLMNEGTRCLHPPEEQEGVRMGLYEDPDGFNFTLAQVT